jgi:hypothetical protein
VTFRWRLKLTSRGMFALLNSVALADTKYRTGIPACLLHSNYGVRGLPFLRQRCSTRASVSFFKQACPYTLKGIALALTLRSSCMDSMQSSCRKNISNSHSVDCRSCIWHEGLMALVVLTKFGPRDDLHASSFCLSLTAET